jgi:hypothetical protein
MPVSVIGSASIAKPGLTPVPTTATLAFLARASIFLASVRFLPTGYDSSSVVETIATFFLSTASICGITFFSEELVQSTATSGLPLLMAPAASLVTRTRSFLSSPITCPRSRPILAWSISTAPTIWKPFRDAT